MKTSYYILLLILFFTKTVFGQDTIVQTDGTQIICQVIEVGTTEIKYKKYLTLQTSPIYDIEKYKVKVIKYADGTQDVFTNPVSPQYNNSVYSPYPNYYSGNINNSNMDVTGAYVSLGAMVSPFNMYRGSVVNNYWHNLYSRENSKGYMQLNNSNALLYSFFMNGTLVLHKQDNWSYEFQYEMTLPNKGIHDSASYADGTHGHFNMWYMFLNDAIQYTRGIDSSNNVQIGGEVSLDIGLIFGGEKDVFYSGNGSYSDSSVNADYTGVHIGTHIAAVGKYFTGKSKSMGFELRAGYRFLKGYTPETGITREGINAPVSLSGPFISLGVVLRLKAHYCINCGFDDDDD